MIENVGTGLAVSGGEKGEAIAPAVPKQAKTRTKNSKTSEALSVVGKQVETFEKQLDANFQGFEKSQVQKLVDRSNAVPANIMNGYVEAMAEVSPDLDSFRQDADDIFGSLVAVCGITLD